MEDRREEIISFCREFYEEHLNNIRNEIIKKYESNEEKIFNALKEPLVKLFRKAKNKRVKYMVVGFLYSSLMTDSGKYIVVLYNELFYLDFGAVSEKVKFQFLESYMKRDVTNITNLAAKKFMRLTEYEREAIKFECGLQYLNVLSVCLKELMQNIMQMESFIQIEKDNDFKVILGEYMGKGNVIYSK